MRRLTGLYVEGGGRRQVDFGAGADGGVAAGGATAAAAAYYVWRTTETACCCVGDAMPCQILRGGSWLGLHLWDLLALLGADGAARLVGGRRAAGQASRGLHAAGTRGVRGDGNLLVLVLNRRNVQRRHLLRILLLQAMLISQRALQDWRELLTIS